MKKNGGKLIGAHFFRIIVRIISSSHNILCRDDSRNHGCISHSRNSVLSEKSGKDTPGESRLELKEHKN